MTFSLTKNKSSSVCSVLECRIGLWAIETIDKLSHNNKGVTVFTWSSFNRDWTQIISFERWVRILYLASVILLATVCCLDHHEIRLVPRKRLAPHVDLVSSTSVAQSTSEKPFSWRGNKVVGSSKIPPDKVPFRCLNMWRGHELTNFIHLKT